jgi:SsrA-binding protein
MAEGVKILAINKKARHDYAVLESMECGIELRGTEVKSMKINRFSYGDAYAKVEKEQLWLVGFHISPYDFGNIHNHEPERSRRLLVHKDEIRQLRRKIMERGLTLIPLKFYLKKGLLKVEIGVCKGKKQFDKREDIKKKDMKREHERDYRIK